MTDDRYETISDEDRLPWLEAVDEDDSERGPSAARLVGWIIVGLVLIGLVVGGVFYLGNRNRTDGGGAIIAAPEGDYKVKPQRPGGMNVGGDGGTSLAASEGAEPKARIDTSAVPEAPVTRPQASQGAQAPPPPAATAAAAPPPAARPAPPAPPPSAAGPVATIQLGAFSSQALAGEAWGELAGRFRYLAPLNRSFVPVQVAGRTLYRLRASGAGAAEICRRLQVAGEACSLVN
ncbi:MAG: SPOR domain-containing protein [Sphingosinicella sp.]